MKHGFTGTRNKPTPVQIFVMHRWLQRMLGEDDEFHHGDCVGADESAHGFVTNLQVLRPGLIVVGHPPVDESRRAFCLCDQTWMPKPFLDRNHDIVNATDWLLALPATEQEVQRSGTWATIRYARRQRKPIVIIYPDGHVGEEVPSL